MTEPLVTLDAVSKDFPLPQGDSVPVLADVTCQVAAGQRIALLGPSGSGKSTLLHLMAGLIEPSGGRIAWPALGARDQLMPTRIQVAFQSPSLFPPLDVADNVALPLLLAHDAPEARAQALDMLTRLGLADLAEKLPEELSGGQAQRVAMARALAVEPDLILADEPTGQLDTATASALMTGLIAFADERGTAIVLATHDRSLGDLMAEVWTVEHGRLKTPEKMMGNT